LLEPTSGTVDLLGVAPAIARRRKRIGFVPQDARLHPWRTVRENVTLPLEVNRAARTNGHVSPDEWVARMGLSDAIDAYPHQLSGGMRQRVALARSLVIDPEVLLMDEPLASLDELTRDDLRDELLRLWEGRARSVVYVTHDIEEAVLLADRVIVIVGCAAGVHTREGGITLSDAAAGFVLGTGVAFALTTVMAWSRPFERTLFPLAILVKLTPIVAVAPLFTLWFGFGTAPKVAIAALITFFPMLVNSFVGLRSADLQEVAFLETLGASGREIFRHLRVPSALPYLFSGARISLNLALIGAVIGEWTGADRGLGRVIFVANA